MTDTEKNTSPMPAEPLNLRRSRHLLARDESQLAVIDVQEKFVPHLPDITALAAQCGRLVQAARFLGIPVLASEQNPEKLGPTVSPLREMLPTPERKMRFSSAECLLAGLRDSGEARRQVVICGIETHVCIMQTAFDILSWGWDVYVVADAVQSRFASDRDWALRRLESNGITLVTTESVLFEWCETAEATEFREISRLVKSRSE